MKALVFGAHGQLGRELVAAAPDGWEVIGFGREDLDITDFAAVDAAVRAHAPDLVFNAAAYTAVDRAEDDAEAAFRVNRDAAAHLAAACGSRARLIHVSTDFVFDGTGSRPYRPDDPTAPLGVYGASKLAGEDAVRAAAPGALIVRTSWLYAAHGRNFVSTMLRLMRERGPVRVVADQTGSPTSAPSLARALWALAPTGEAGVFHYANAGVASWYDFAVAIGEEAAALGLLGRAATVIPITTAEYPTPARRPAYSVLDTDATAPALGAPIPHWRDELRQTLEQLKTRGEF